MNRIKIIIGLILGKNIIVYNKITKEVICSIGGEKEIFKNRVYYELNKWECFKIKDDKLLYIEKEV